MIQIRTINSEKTQCHVIMTNTAKKVGEPHGIA